MNRQTQALLLAFLGAVLLRLALTDVYLRYVSDWMKWPLVASGLLLLSLAAGQLFGAAGSDADEDDSTEDQPGDGPHGVPTVTWLLALPGLVVFVISPPQLGSYLAERRADTGVAVAEPEVLTDLDPNQAVPVDVTEFVYLAQVGGQSLAGQPVELTGFVSYGAADTWYLTRLSVGCCAADATPYQVQVQSAEARPRRDQWLAVTGTYVPGSGTTTASWPTLEASTITLTSPPAQTYE